MKNNLETFRNSLQLTKRAFAAGLGVNEGSYNRMEAGMLNVSANTITAIRKAYPDVSIDWLLYSDSALNKSKKASRLPQAGISESGPYLRGGAKRIDTDDQTVMRLPLVNQYAYAGYLSGFADEEYLDDLPHIPFYADREYKGEYMAFEVRGDSMDDGSRQSIIEGDILLCREISATYWQHKLHIHKWNFVIVHREDGILIKQIAAHNVNTGIITIHSLNPLYEDKKLNLKDIVQLFNVVKIERKL
jgi:DNA-binding XRE family transcriptional regulator